MKYTFEERLSIGKEIYDNAITKYGAALKYGIGIDSARLYMRLYRDANGLPPKNKPELTPEELARYERMTRNELILELTERGGENRS